MNLEQVAEQAFSLHAPARFLGEVESAARGVACGVGMGAELKELLRKQYLRRSHPNSYSEATRHADHFWRRYEIVNRVLCENDPVYSIVNPGTALSTTADALGWQAPASGQGRILEIIIGGEAKIGRASCRE